MSPTEKLIVPPTQEESDIATQFVINRPQNVGRQIDYFAQVLADYRFRNFWRPTTTEQLKKDIMTELLRSPNGCTDKAPPEFVMAKELECERILTVVFAGVKKASINTNVRLFDLVRFMRAELHEADLITDSEYAWLSGGAPMATSHTGGSPSPRRLEDYDELQEKLKELKTALQVLADATDEDCPWNDRAEKTTTALEKARDLLK